MPILNCSMCASRLDSVFCDLEAQDLGDLNKAKTTNKYKKGQVLFYEGNPPTGIFCLTQGNIKLTKQGENGKEIILRILSPGQVIGLRGVLAEQPYAATAVAMEDSIVCFLDKSFFAFLIQKDPKTALNVIRKLSDELSEAEQKLSDMANKDVRHRLSQLLLSLSKTHGTPTGSETLIDLRLTRVDLASMISTTPETIIRLLSDFVNLGYIRLDGKKIYMSSPKDFVEQECANEF